MIDWIAQFLTELTGGPVSRLAAGGVVAVAIICVLMLLFGAAWIDSGRIDWDAVEADRKRLEEDDHE
jgi:hypothetical protein